jgi:hypothetical protein
VDVRSSREFDGGVGGKPFKTGYSNGDFGNRLESGDETPLVKAAGLTGDSIRDGMERHGRKSDECRAVIVKQDGWVCSFGI